MSKIALIQRNICVLGVGDDEESAWNNAVHNLTDEHWRHLDDELKNLSYDEFCQRRWEYNKNHVSLCFGSIPDAVAAYLNNTGNGCGEIGFALKLNTQDSFIDHGMKFGFPLGQTCSQSYTMTQLTYIIRDRIGNPNAAVTTNDIPSSWFEYFGGQLFATLPAPVLMRMKQGMSVKDVSMMWFEYGVNWR